MGEAARGRVQWVTRQSDMTGLVERLTQRGAKLVARSGFEAASRDLDELDDADPGFLSIAEFSLEPGKLRRQVIARSRRLGSGETMIVDLTRACARVQVFPVAVAARLIVRRTGGVERLPRCGARHGRRDARWLAGQLAADTAPAEEAA